MAGNNAIPALKPISFACIENRKTITVKGEQILELTTQAFDPKKNVGFDTNLTRLSPDLEGKPHLLAKILAGSEDYTDIILHYNYVSNPFTIDKNMVFVLPNIQDALKAIASGINSSDRNSSKKLDNQSKKELNKSINKKDKKRIMELMKQANPSLASELASQAKQQETTSGDASKNGDVVINSASKNGDVVINSAGINEKTGNPATLDDLIASLDFVKTPNMAESDQYKAIDGKIIFGSNISNKRCSGDVTATQGKTELIRIAVRDMIKKGEI